MARLQPPRTHRASNLLSGEISWTEYGKIVDNIDTRLIFIFSRYTNQQYTYKKLQEIRT